MSRKVQKISDFVLPYKQRIDEFLDKHIGLRIGVHSRKTDGKLNTSQEI